MKLRELLQQMIDVQKKIGASTPYICGGTPRDRYMGRLDNIADVDITTGDKTIDYLSQEFYAKLAQKYNVKRTTANDGHSTIFLGSFKMDYSSNFNAPGIDQYLLKLGIKNPTDMQKEMFSRDFTCNALLLSFDLKNLMDPTHRGFKDIKDRMIRTCLDPAVTLTTNKNRVVRSIYLAAKLDFNVDPAIIDFVKKNPQTAAISTNKVTGEKLQEAFKRDADKASYLITQMGIWNHIPISDAIYPYYEKHLKNSMIDKKAYFQGGGGVNEPTPGHKKYKSDPALVVQPRFKEPLYHNYDLYTIPGMEDVGPGTGWHGLQNYKSVSDFLKARRERLKPRYVSDDSWQLDDGKRTKKNPNIEARASLFKKLVKLADKECKDSDVVYTDSRDAYICGNCLHMSENCGGPAPSAKDLHAGKNHNPDRIDWRDGSDRGGDPNYQKWKKNVAHTDENDGPNFDYGKGLYSNMDKYKIVKDFEEYTDKDPGAFFADDNADHMLPPKEHGTSIYNWKNSPYQGIPKAPKRHDSNKLDFPIDDQVTPIIGDSESFETPIKLGPSVDGNPNDGISPGAVGLGDIETYPSTPQIGGYLDKYLTQNDQDDKPESDLDFGYDLTGNDEPEDQDSDMQDIFNKYLNPAPTHGLYGLPDGVDLPDEDLGDPTDLNPDYGTRGPDSLMYEDKWNI